MKKMYFNRLTIISKTEKKAAQFDFSKNYNLILSNEKNSVGKSSLVKNIFWSFGCEPQFDDKWRSLNCQVIVDFEVEDETYQIARHGSYFVVSYPQGEQKIFTSVGGEFSSEMMRIFKFNALLPVRDKDEVTIPPPAYYFLPFYIDQKLSWASAWASFSNLGQFSGWKKIIIPYHTGMIDKDYFNITRKIYSIKVVMKEVVKQIERLDTAISVVSEFSFENNNLAISDDEIDKIEEQINVEIMDIHYQQEVLFEELSALRIEKAHIGSQIVLAEISFEETNEDYEFAESLDEVIECPTCGTAHDNSIINRFSLFQDKKQAEDMLGRLKAELVNIEAKIEEKTDSFEILKTKIHELDEKYLVERGRSLSDVIEAVASKSVQKKVENSKCFQVDKLHNLNSNEKTLIENRVKNSRDKRKLVREKFQEYFPRFLSKLKAFGVNSTSIKSPENHTKVSESGGAAESTRAMLAYYVSVYNLINDYGEHVLCPFVIDTPNQHEQAAKHYDSIVSLLINELPENAQLFLCGMNSEKLKLLKDASGAKVIHLEVEHSLLNSEDFQMLDAKYSKLFE